MNKGIIGEIYLETAECYHSLGKLYSEQKKNAEFEEILNRAMKIYKQIYGNNHACVAIVLNHLGTGFMELKRYEDAIG